MSAARKAFGPGSLAWLSLSVLGVVALVLAGGMWVAIREGWWGGVPRRLLDVCLLLPQSAAATSWSWMSTHPLTALALASSQAPCSGLRSASA